MRPPTAHTQVLPWVTSLTCHLAGAQAHPSRAGPRRALCILSIATSGTESPPWTCAGRVRPQLRRPLVVRPSIASRATPFQSLVQRLRSVQSHACSVRKHDQQVGNPARPRDRGRGSWRASPGFQMTQSPWPRLNHGPGWASSPDFRTRQAASCVSGGLALSRRERVRVPVHIPGDERVCGIRVDQTN